MGCLSVKMSRVGGDGKATMERATEPLSVTMTKANEFSVRMGLVCNASVGVLVLWVEDGMLLTVDNNMLTVKK